MAEKRTASLGARIKESIYSALKTHCDEADISFADYIENIISKDLGLIPNDANRLDQLERELQELRDLVKEKLCDA